MLYIIAKRKYFMFEYIFQMITPHENVCVIDFERFRLKGWLRVCKYLQVFWRSSPTSDLSRFYGSEFLKGLNHISHEDRVLFFGIHNLKDLCILDRHIKARQRDVFLWDPMSSICRSWWSKVSYYIRIRTVKMLLSTFDPRDARRYGFTWRPQVYRHPNVEMCMGDGVFYIGQDKRRERKLERVARLLREGGVATDFYVVGDRHSRRSTLLRPYYHEKPLPYEETLRRANKSLCILEIMQRGQSGPTLRTMEALFLKKKLITDNRFAKLFEFYHPNNIMIVDRYTTSDDILCFLSRPYVPVSDAVIRKHEVETWIKQFL